MDREELKKQLYGAIVEYGEAVFYYSAFSNITSTKPLNVSDKHFVKARLRDKSQQLRELIDLALDEKKENEDFIGLSSNLS